ncbi:MAG: Tol-Pal system protein TolB [Parachlamydiaceae bacterium]|nr:Tol-Pal system protein TolB [Parachlamydiaceae bacterium]
MQRQIVFLLIALAFLIPGHSQSQQVDTEPMLVHLTTEQKLWPIYLIPFIDKNSGFESSYISKLEKVLQFDLSHNGFTQIVPSSPQKARLSNASDFNDFGKAAEWSSNGVSFVVKVEIKEKKITAKILQAASNSIKAIDTLPLTGNLNQDRRQIHLIADTIQTALLGTEGIASTRILYTFKYPVASQPKPEWLSEIWEMDYDGGNMRKISDDSSGYCITPCHLPAKSGFQSAAFLYVSYKNGQPKIFMAPLKEGAAVRLNYLRGNQLMPTVSRQRDKIAFISDIAGNPDLFIQEFSPETGPIGKPRQIFTARGATQGTPTFSPDGKQIAFVSNKDGSPRIYLLTIPAAETKLKEVKPRLITHANRESTAPCWSPDGTRLAYCARHGSERQIWIYDFSTDEEWQLTSGTGDKENPSWASNSLHLTYNTTGKNNADLYIININQRIPEKISVGNGEKRFPSWEPRN